MNVCFLGKPLSLKKKKLNLPLCVFLGLLFTMDNNSYIKPLRPSREIKIVISVCFLLARLCDRGGCVFVRGCGAVTFSGASRCVTPPVPPGPGRASEGAGCCCPGPAGRDGTNPGERGTSWGSGVLLDPGKAAPVPFELSPAAPGQSCGEPHGRPGPVGIVRRGPAEPGGKRGTAAPRPPCPRQPQGRPRCQRARRLRFLRCAGPGTQPGTCEDRAPGRDGGLLAAPGITPRVPAAPPSCPGLRCPGRSRSGGGGPGAAGPHGGGCTGLTPGRCPAPLHLSGGRRLPPRPRRVSRSGAGSGRGAPLAAADTRVLQPAIHEQGEGEPPAPGSPSAASGTGPGKRRHLPRAGPAAAAAGRPRAERPTAAGTRRQRGLGFPGTVGLCGRRRRLGPCRGWAPPGRGTARRGAAWSRPQRPSSRAPSARTPRPTPLPSGRGSRTCPAGCAGPGSPVGPC